VSKLFLSKARSDVMELFLFNPENSYYQRQISELTGQPIRAIQREIINLLELGLIEKHDEGNRVYYRINKKCPIYSELKSIFIKTAGLAEYMQKKLNEKRVKFAFIYGSYAKNTENISSDIDLFVVGDMTAKELSGEISKVKKELAREINYVVMPVDELKQRASAKENYIMSVIKDKKIFIAGDENEFKTIIKPGKN